MIYLDSAATTWQKPHGVAQAVMSAMKHMASPGRGSHSLAERAAETAFACREEVAKLFGLDDPSQVVFTCNATHGLNIAIKTLVKPGDAVVISGYEHNAVTRPLHAIGNVDIRVADGALFCPDEMVKAFEQKLTPDVSCVICTHMSNVFGYILPIEEIARLCMRHGVPLIVDASQSAGCLPIDIKKWNAAFVAAPGHKGLYGPQGTGVLMCGVPADTLIEGGTGSASVMQQMPEYLPDRLEAGTHNIPGIAGLLAGLRFVRSVGVERIGRHEIRLSRQLSERLSRLPGVEVFDTLRTPSCRGGVLSFRVDDKDVEEIGQRLAERGFAVRCGLHCAPVAHQTVGTLETGTIRVSFSAFNTPKETELFLRTITQLLK